MARASLHDRRLRDGRAEPGVGVSILVDRGAEGLMDAPLVRAARGGSQSAFARLVAAHERALRGFLRKSGFGDADDIAQEAFLAAWSSLGRLREDEGFRAWLFGIAWRKALDHSRAARRSARRDQAWSEEQAEEVSRARPIRPTAWRWRRRWPTCRRISGPA
jgi:DNA-directed RNA polymerase specialized sigma24 family protein